MILARILQNLTENSSLNRKQKKARITPTGQKHFPDFLQLMSVLDIGHIFTSWTMIAAAVFFTLGEWSPNFAFDIK